LIKFATGDRHAWWKLILIMLVLGVIGIAALWVYGGQFYHRRRRRHRQRARLA